jgi:hypothetical protein
MNDIDPKVQLFVGKENQKERQVSDDKYAIKLVEKIVFYMVGAAGIAVLGALLRLVILG